MELIFNIEILTYHQEGPYFQAQLLPLLFLPSVAKIKKIDIIKKQRAS